MILFWLISAVFVAIALAFVVPPLIQRVDQNDEADNKEANIEVYRDQLAELEADLKNGLISQEQYRQDRDDIERRLLEDVTAVNQGKSEKSTRTSSGHGFAYAIALAIPVAAIVLYLQIGNPASVSGVPNATSRPAPSGLSTAQEQGQMTAERIQANVAALARRLEQNPNDVQGWTMLGRSYIALERYSEASQAYARASKLKPDDADLLADYAFSLGMANAQRLEGQPLELINKALKLDPNNLKALELAGSAAFQAKDYNRAISYWQRVLAASPPDSELARVLSERIQEAKSLAGSGAK